MMKYWILLLILGLIPFATAEINILSSDGTTDDVVNIVTPEPPINYSLIPTVNSSLYADIWLTSDGDKDDVSDITYDEISGGDVDASGFDVLAEWFRGKFNWTTGTSDGWIVNSFDGSTLDADFNESKLATIYYNATQSQLVEGTIDGGTLVDTQHQDGNYDGNTFNFSEVAGSPGLDLRMNFTGITTFNAGVMRYKTSSLAGDYPIIQLWSYDDSDWEDYPNVAESESFATITQPVFDSTNHVGTLGENVGVVQMRIYKASNGNTNNHYYVDWVAISKGYGTPAGEEVDPHSIHRDGNTTTTASIPFAEGATFEGNVTIDHTSQEALLVRKDGDSGDVFVVDTLTSKVLVPPGGLGSPGFAFTTDTDTGFGLVSGNTFGLFAGGNQIGTWGTTKLDLNDYITLEVNNITVENFKPKDTNFSFYNSTDDLIVRFTGDGKVIADNFFGSGANLHNVNYTESDPIWTANSTLVPYLASLNTFTARQDITLSTGAGFPLLPGDTIMVFRNDGSSRNDAWLQLIGGGTGQIGVSFGGGMSESVYFDRALGTMNIDMFDNHVLKFKVVSGVTIADINGVSGGKLSLYGDSSGDTSTVELGTSSARQWQLIAKPLLGGTKYPLNLNWEHTSNGGDFTISWNDVVGFTFTEEGNLNVTGNVTVGTGASYSGFGACYLKAGVLGHCTDALNVTGGCSCVAN